MQVVIDTTSSNKGAQAIIQKYEKLKANRGTWESHWKEIADYTLPTKNNVWGGSVKGEKKGAELFDATGVRSAEKLAGALHGMLTNSSTQWHSFSTGNHEIDSIPAVSKWIQNAAKKVTFIMNNSNFQPEIHEVYMDLTTFGTSHFRVEEDEKEIVRFSSRPIYEVAVSENYQGLIDTVSYEYKETLQQIVEQFADKCPADLIELANKEPLQEMTIIHHIEPTDRLPKDLRHPTMPFTSVHILKDKVINLKVSGFNENPCIISRFYKLSGEMYGRSPAMMALPDIKTANQMMKTWLEGAQLAVKPPIQLPDEGVLLPVKLTPGGTNYYRADSKDRIEPIITGANPNIGNQIIELLHANIQKSFYIDQLHLVENDRMTAAEVMQRRDESLRTMSPIIGRLFYELLAPVVMRVFNIAARRGLIDPPPQELRASKLEVKFLSQLARAQESIEGDNLNRALMATMQLAQLDPTVIDVINPDAFAHFNFKTYGAPLHLLRTEEEKKQVRAQRQQMQAQAQQAQLDQMNSQSAVNVSKAKSLQEQ